MVTQVRESAQAIAREATEGTQFRADVVGQERTSVWAGGDTGNPGVGSRPDGVTMVGQLMMGFSLFLWAGLHRTVLRSVRAGRNRLLGILTGLRRY
jgi:hypothetical protein